MYVRALKSTPWISTNGSEFLYSSNSNSLRKWNASLLSSSWIVSYGNQILKSSPSSQPLLTSRAFSYLCRAVSVHSTGQIIRNSQPIDTTQHTWPRTWILNHINGSKKLRLRRLYFNFFPHCPFPNLRWSK